MTRRILDLFAGAGGWDVAARSLGCTSVGVEQNPAACATRRAAGLATVEADVTTLNPLDFPADGFIASPPCQEWSLAGRGAARAEQAAVLDAARWWAWDDPFEGRGSSLVLEPLRWIHAAWHANQPYGWIALEQVPPCLPVWEAYAQALCLSGYHSVTGILSSDSFGVPQSRRRAVLLARHCGNTYCVGEAVAYCPRAVALPAPTRRMTLADLFPDLPAGTEQVSNYRGGPQVGADGGSVREYGRRRLDQPSATITSKSHSWEFSDGTRRPMTVAEAAAVQGFPPDFPWVGGVIEQRLQIGNAVPVGLARALIQSVAGLGSTETAVAA